MKLFFYTRDNTPKRAVREQFERIIDELNGVVSCRLVMGEIADVLANKEVDCVMSPGNSYGFMDGGLDQALVDAYGPRLEVEVQTAISIRYHGELPVGSTVTITKNPRNMPDVIYAPTMRGPRILSPTGDEVYTAVRATLAAATSLFCDTLVIPACGCGVGALPPRIMADQTFEAICQHLFRDRRPKTWRQAKKFDAELRRGIA